MLRENIFEAAVRAPKKNVRATLGEAINHIATHDFPSKWTNLLQQILSGCQSGVQWLSISCYVVVNW